MALGTAVILVFAGSKFRNVRGCSPAPLAGEQWVYEVITGGGACGLPPAHFLNAASVLPHRRRG
jgi:hypothetical protein